MAQLPTPETLQQRLDTWRERYHVAGAALGVLLGDEVVAVGSGVININTGVETTPDTLFQIGSITKVYTTTLIMQLVDEGRVDLDAPARRYLPELRLSDASATEAVTIRQLLSHTSGIDGDFFEDFGRGDDCLEKYVAACAGLPQMFAPGTNWSYCNAGFVILGRIIETLTGASWDAALRARLLEPLGLRHTVTLPEEALLHRTAAGHNVDPSLTITLQRPWTMARAQGPAGSTPCASVADMLAFARFHLDRGRSPSGVQLLSEESVKKMQAPQARLPDRPGPALPPHWGLGWMLFNWDGRRVIGHDGGTIGQQSCLRILPDEGLVVASLANTAPTGGLLHARAVAWLLNEMYSIAVPGRPQPPEVAPDFDLAPYAGTYERTGVRVTVELADGVLMATVVNTGPLPSPPVPPSRLFPVTPELFLSHAEALGVFNPLNFGALVDGRPGYLFDSRISPRVS